MVQAAVGTDFESAAGKVFASTSVFFMTGVFMAGVACSDGFPPDAVIDASHAVFGGLLTWGCAENRLQRFSGLPQARACHCSAVPEAES